MVDIEEAKLQLEREKLNLEADKLRFEQSKFDSEAEKRKAEIAKAQADALKTRLEAQEMSGSFWKRPAWVTPIMQGVAVIIAVAGTLFSFALNREIAQSDSAAANAQLQASRAQLEAAQAKLDAKQAEIDKQNAVDQQSVAERRSQNATKKLESVQDLIVAENKELDALKKQKDEVSYQAALAPAETLLDNLGDRGYLPEGDEKRLIALLSPKDSEAAGQREKFLQSFANDPNAPINKRLAALKALLTQAQSAPSPDREAAAALKDKFIQIATSPAGENPFKESKWEALEEVLGAAAAGPYICDEYQNYANRGLAFNNGGYRMADHISALFRFEPKCASAQWDLLDPRMDVVRAASGDTFRLPRELVLARYVQKGNPRHASEKFGTDLDVLGRSVYVDWAEAHIVGISLWVNNNDEQIRSLHLERWNVPESHHIDWREGDDFVSALKKWPAENQKLAHVFSEPGLAHLRKCRMKVLEMILLDCYVGEPEIEESCPAETLN